MEDNIFDKVHEVDKVHDVDLKKQWKTLILIMP